MDILIAIEQTTIRLHSTFYSNTIFTEVQEETAEKPPCPVRCLSRHRPA